MSFVPYILSPRNISGEGQKSNCSVVLENFKAARHTWYMLDEINTCRRATGVALNCFFDTLCVAFNVMCDMKMQY